MTFKKIVLFTLKEYNENTPKEECFPQEGHVINVLLGSPSLMQLVAVGFAK